jgi:hypothetical protein
MYSAGSHLAFACALLCPKEHGLLPFQTADHSGDDVCLGRQHIASQVEFDDGVGRRYVQGLERLPGTVGY